MRASPLAEGRELKFITMKKFVSVLLSPLAEGRELKFQCFREKNLLPASPLAEGRELKYPALPPSSCALRRPSRRGVN